LYRAVAQVAFVCRSLRAGPEIEELQTTKTAMPQRSANQSLDEANGIQVELLDPVALAQAVQARVAALRATAAVGNAESIQPG
jgi:hypothetical protein